MKEVWKDVPNWEGMYQVSDLGRVRSLDREDNRGYKRRGHLLQPGWRPTGYGIVSLYFEGVPTQRYVHALVLETFIGDCPPGKQVCHTDGDAANNRLSNLRYGTPKENCHDRVGHGTMICGEQHYCARLLPEQVHAIRRLVKQGRSFASIAKDFSVATSTVGGIISGKNWKHLK